MSRESPSSEETRSREYRDVHLGLFSSHPYWLERGSDWIRRGLVGAAVFLYLLVTYLWMRGQGIDRMIPAFSSWLAGDSGRKAAGMVAFSAGMLAAASFQLRMALRKQAGDLARQRDLPVRFSPATAVVVAIAGFVLPLVLTFAPGLPFEARFFGALIALTPAVTLSMLLPSPPSRPSMIPWFSGGVLIPLLVVGSASEAAATWIRNHLPLAVIEFFPILQTLDGVRQSCMALFSMTAVVFAFNLLSWIQGLRLSRKPGSGAGADRKPSFWRKLLRALGIGGKLVDAAEHAENEAEERRKQLIEWVIQLARHCGFSPEPACELAHESVDVSQFGEDSSFDLLMHGNRPTLDQFKALRDFTDLSVRCLDGPDGRVNGTGFEMILEGPAGSGRTSVLDAMALLSLLGQGTGTVLFVADAGRIAFAIQRLQKRIESIHLAPYATVGSIQDAWNAARRDEAPPDLCVTTPELWEETLPGQMVREGKDYDATRRLMMHYSTMLVDDWQEHPVEVRAHLPFILDKHRLFLESEMLPRACVVAFPHLTDTGRNLAVSRIMGDAGVIDEGRQVIRLRHRPLPNTTCVDVVCDSVDAAIDKLALALGESGEPSILLRKGIDLEEAERQTLDYQTKYQNSKVTVCYCGDQVETVAGDMSAILMKAACGPEAVFALRAHRHENAIVFIRVRDRREIGSSGRITPLIVDRSGRGMAESHLRNILRFMDAGSPVSRRCWGQLGLDIPSECGTKLPSKSAGTLVLDLPELLPEADRRARPYLSKLGSYISLKDTFKYLEGVDCHWIPDPGPAPVAKAATGQSLPAYLYLPIADDSDTQAAGSSVLWLGNEGSEIGRSQLHYADTLLLKRHRVFCPDRIREVASRGLEIDATKFRDNGSDAIHPKIEMSWSGEISAPLDHRNDSAETPKESWQVATGYGGPAHGFIWADLGSASGVHVTSRLIERVDDQDRPSPCFAYQYEWRARARPLLLCPTHSVIDNQEEYLDALKAFFSEAVQWGTEHPGFLPGLTYALTRGLEIDLPSSGFFGKILAFRLSGEMGRFAKVVVWFVEPSGTGRTLSNAVHELLKEDGYLKELATRMDLILRQGWEKSPPVELARFWLPRSHIKKSRISILEKRLVKELRDIGLSDNDIDAVPISCKLECPHCKQEFSTMFSWGAGPHAVKHCDKVVQLLLTGRDYKVLTPSDLALGKNSKILMDKPLRHNQSPHELCLSIWNSLQDRISYERDHHIDSLVPYEGDLWLHPDDAWITELGDCDDHATLFTEWSRSLDILSYTYMGWVNGRNNKDSYHAWSVAVIDDKEYLIEATGKPDAELELFYNGIEVRDWKYELDPDACRFSSAGIEILENDSWRGISCANLISYNRLKTE